jgi:hypothetical protein
VGVGPQVGSRCCDLWRSAIAWRNALSSKTSFRRRVTKFCYSDLAVRRAFASHLHLMRNFILELCHLAPGFYVETCTIRYWVNGKYRFLLGGCKLPAFALKILRVQGRETCETERSDIVEGDPLWGGLGCSVGCGRMGVTRKASS